MKLLSLALFVLSTSAHTIFQQIGVNGVMAPRHEYMRLPEYDGPIENVWDQAMTCNGGPNPLKRFSNKILDVPAGSQFTLFWSHTLDTPYGGMTIDASHKGPMLVYMAKVASALGPPPNSGWFKIYHDGLNNGDWAVDKLIRNQGKLTVTIPHCIPPGEYLLRGELIALHSAHNYGGAQLYMTCAQIRITGSGNKTPQTYNIPGIYQQNDPGIHFSIWTNPRPYNNYPIPGPPVFQC